MSEPEINPGEPESRKRPLFINIVLSIVLLVSIVWVGLGFLHKPKMPADFSQRLDVLESEFTRQKQAIASVEERILKMDQQITFQNAVAPTEDGENSDLDLASKLKSIESRLDQLSAKADSGAAYSHSGTPASSDVHNAIAGVEARLNALETSKSHSDADQAKTIATLNAFYRLQNMVLIGKPYSAEYIQFADLVDDNADLAEPLDIINSYASEGIPSIHQLSEEFSTTARQALAPKASQDASFGERLSANLSSLVTIRKVGEHQKGLTLQAIIARSEAYLAKGELEAAVAEVESMTISEQGMFTDWLESANARLSIPSTLTEIQDKLLASFGGNSNTSAKSER